LKQKFVDIVNPKVSAGVRTFIGMSDIVAVDKRLRVEAPDVALRFITKPEYVEIFKQAATELGFSDVTVIKKEDAPPPLSPIDAILNKARNLGIPTEKR
jgi:hypothetical protein